MTNTDLLPSDAATQKLIDEAMAMPASQTHPLYGGLDLGTDPLEFDVHVVASRWIDAGQGPRAHALCGEELSNYAYGLRESLPMCWQCAEVLEARA